MSRTPAGLVLFLVVVLLASVSLAVADSQSTSPTEIDNCTTIDEPGRYVLTRDITNGGRGDGFTYASHSCLTIRSDDVVLEGRDHRVDALGNSDTTGIAVLGDDYDPISNVTVSNVTLTDWNRGVFVRHGENGTIRDSRIASNAYGVSIERSAETRVVDSNVRGNLVGVYEDSESVGTRLTDSSFAGNYAADFVPDGGETNESTDGSDADDEAAERR